MKKIKSFINLFYILKFIEQRIFRRKGIKMKKLSLKLFEIVGIFVVQLIVGFIIIKIFLKMDWNVISFISDPAMIAFWVAYLIINIVILMFKNKHSKSSNE